MGGRAGHAATSTTAASMTTYELPEHLEPSEWTLFTTGPSGYAFRSLASHQWLVVLPQPVSLGHSGAEGDTVPSREVWTDSLLFVLCLTSGTPSPQYCVHSADYSHIAEPVQLSLF